MVRLRGRRVVGPQGPPLVGTHGFGGPVPVDPSKQKPIPGVSGNNPIPNPLAGVGDAITAAIGDVVDAGEVLIGVALVVLGLLLATGALGKGIRLGGKAALFAASRGAVK